MTDPSSAPIKVRITASKPHPNLDSSLAGGIGVIQRTAEWIFNDSITDEFLRAFLVVLGNNGWTVVEVEPPTAMDTDPEFTITHPQAE